MKKLLVGFGVAAFALLPAFSEAAYLKADKTVFVGASEAVRGNAYVAGGNVTVSGAVSGDLLAAGGTVYISGSVDRDIMVSGGTVTISGASAEDLRVAGGNVTVGGNFAGELLGAGGQITVTPDATIAKDSYLSGGTVLFEGDEKGNLHVAGGSVHIDGTVAGNLTIKSAEKVTIGPHAVIRGNLEYTAPYEAEIEEGARVLGATDFRKTELPVKRAAGWPVLGFITFWWVVKILIVLTAAYLLWFARREDVVSALSRATSRFWRELFAGFAFLVLTPVAAILVGLTVIGIIPAAVAALIYGALLILATPVAGLFTASLLARSHTTLAWYHILLGVVVFELVKVVPFVGWLAAFVVCLASLGALVNVLRGKL